MAKLVGELAVQLKLDTKHFTAAMTRAKSNMGDLAKYAGDRNRLITSSYNKLAKDIGAVATRIEKAQKAINDASGMHKQAADAMKAVFDVWEDIEKTYSNIQEMSKKTAKEYQSGSKATIQSEKQLTEALREEKNKQAAIIAGAEKKTASAKRGKASTQTKSEVKKKTKKEVTKPPVVSTEDILNDPVMAGITQEPNMFKSWEQIPDVTDKVMSSIKRATQQQNAMTEEVTDTLRAFQQLEEVARKINLRTASPGDFEAYQTMARKGSLSQAELAAKKKLPIVDMKTIGHYQAKLKDKSFMTKDRTTVNLAEAIKAFPGYIKELGPNIRQPQQAPRSDANPTNIRATRRGSWRHRDMKYIKRVDNAEKITMRSGTAEDTKRLLEKTAAIKAKFAAKEAEAHDQMLNKRAAAMERRLEAQEVSKRIKAIAARKKEEADDIKMRDNYNKWYNDAMDKKRVADREKNKAMQAKEEKEQLASDQKLISASSKLKEAAVLAERKAKKKAEELAAKEHNDRIRNSIEFDQKARNKMAGAATGVQEDFDAGQKTNKVLQKKYKERARQEAANKSSVSRADTSAQREAESYIKWYDKAMGRKEIQARETSKKIIATEEAAQEAADRKLIRASSKAKEDAIIKQRAAAKAQAEREAKEHNDRIRNSIEFDQKARRKMFGEGSKATPQVKADFVKGQEDNKTLSREYAKQEAIVKKVAREKKKINDEIQKSIKKMTVVNRAATKWEKTTKNISRITSGIMISRAFYTGIQQVTAMKDHVMQMAKSMETTQMAFAVMVKDAPLAKELSEYVMDYANRSAFSFETATKAAQKLMAYGFETESIGAVLETIGDATAAIGDPQAFGAIAKALGQINTKGKLAQQEVLQLTEAGIPAYEILKNQLKLTGEEMDNIGRAGISSQQALDALLAGMQEKYKGTMDLYAQTMEGLQENVRDTASFLVVELTKPLYNAWRETLSGMADTLNSWVSTVRSSGIGGLIDSIFSPEVAQLIRQTAASVDLLANVFLYAWQAISPFVNMMAQHFAVAMNIAIPIIAGIVHALFSFVEIVLKCEWAVKLLTAGLAAFTVYSAVAAVINGIVFVFGKLWSVVMSVYGVIRGLSVSFMLAAKAGGFFAGVMEMVSIVSTIASLNLGKFLMVVTGVVAAVAAFIAIFKGFNSVIDGFLGSFSKFTSKNYFKPTMDKNTASAGKFNQAIGASKDGLDEMGEAAKEAGKKADSMLQSFDEVFTIQDPDETGGGGNGGGIEVPEIPDFGDIGGGLPDFGDEDLGFGDMFDGIKNLFSGFIQWCKDFWEGVKVAISPEFWFDWAAEGGPFAGLQQGIGNVLDGLRTIIDGFAQFLAGALMLDPEMIQAGWQKIWDGLGIGAKGIVDTIIGIFTGLGEWLDGIFLGWWGDSWINCKNSFAAFGDNIGLIVEGIRNFFHGLIDFLIGGFTLDWERFSEGWKNMVQGAGDFIKGIIDLIPTWLGGMMDWIDSVFTGWWGDSWETVKVAFGGPIEIIRETLNGLRTSLKGVIDFLVGVFTLDWKRAWQGVKDIFYGIFSGIGNFFIGIMNRIIDTMNWVIKQINKISFTVPDWVPIVGGEHVGANISPLSKIPYLAKGGIVTQQTLAMMGEGGKREAVIPLENGNALEEIADRLAAKMSGGNPPVVASGGDSVTLNVGVLVADERGLRELERRLKSVRDQEDRRRF